MGNTYQEVLEQLHADGRQEVSLNQLQSEGFPQTFIDQYNLFLNATMGGFVVIHRNPNTPKLVGYHVEFSAKGTKEFLKRD